MIDNRNDGRLKCFTYIRYFLRYFLTRSTAVPRSATLPRVHLHIRLTLKLKPNNSIKMGGVS